MERYTLICRNKKNTIGEFNSDAEEGVVHDVIKFVSFNINFDNADINEFEAVTKTLQLLGWKVNQITKKTNVFEI